MERPFGFRVRERRRPAVWVSRAGLDLKGRRFKTIHPLRARRHTGGESETPSRHEGREAVGSGRTVVTPGGTGGVLAHADRLARRLAERRAALAGTDIDD